MFYHLFYPLSADYSAFNVFRYITFRSIFAFMLAALVSIIWGKKFIQFMRNKQFGQIIRSDGPESHFCKAGTPTMGGCVILGSLLVALLFCGNFVSYPVLITLFVTVSFFVLGFIDDYLKVLKNDPKGVSAKGKLLWQFITGLTVGLLIYHLNITDTKLYIPFVKDPIIDFGFFYIFFVAFVIVASSNAVNLTDGLDGLAIGPVVTSSASLGLLAYVSGHSEISAYLFVPYVENVGELMVIAFAVIGAGVGFLWYNSYPAQIFMGDSGSLFLGGLLGTLAVVTKNEILYIVIGGIFVVEAVSVILQVGSYKLRKKRIFKMAPIHHHFELNGWPEPKVIVRFWIVSMFLAILAIATLKTR
ncbi:MAG: phospho-N-acetylmuramoyl-pentapeptide-transferase [Bacteriovoracaceae bacterium]|nr:phospho-N-acetylmuramoyl-pentapeptide-transferase [Bacteriovoracaceae bacterium]